MYYRCHYNFTVHRFTVAVIFRAIHICSLDKSRIEETELQLQALRTKNKDSIADLVWTLDQYFDSRIFRLLNVVSLHPGV